MSYRIRWIVGCLLAGLTFSSGCRTHTENGALFGGLLGAGTGAIIGGAAGNPAAGAAIGAGVGGLTGAAIGSDIDETDARNRALIEAQLGRQVAAGAVTVPEVLTMSQAKVRDDLISNHVRAHGLAAPLTTSDLVTLQQAGVNPQVIQTMQSAPIAQAPQARTVVIRESAPPPIVVEHWGPGYGPYYRHPHHW